MRKFLVPLLLALSVSEAAAQPLAGGYGPGPAPSSGSGSVSLTGTAGVVVTPSPITGTGTIGVTTPDNAYSANHTVAAGDMAGTMSLTGSATLTFPAISGTVLASGMTTCWSNLGSGTWSISTTPTINGLPSTSLVPGSSGCVVSNGTSLDFQAGQSLPSGTQLGGVISGTLAAHNFATGISSSTGALTGVQPVVGDLGNVAANTVIGNFTSGSAAPSANTINSGSSCGDGTHALNYTNGTGIGCQALSGGSSGGGMFNYSDNGVTVTANTYFAPAGGGGAPQTTEAAVSVPSPSATTVSKLSVSISGTLGGLSTGFTVTLRQNGADTALTCTFNPSAATACVDNTHSVNIAAADVIDWKIVTAGTITGTPTIGIFAANGTSGVGVTSVATNNGLTGGTITTTGTIGLATIAADNVLMNSTGSTAAPIATVVPDCHGAANAQTYNTSTHAYGCNTIAGGGGSDVNYVPNNYYWGDNVTLANGAVGSTTVTQWQPIKISAPVTISQLCAVISTVSSGNNFQLGFYANDNTTTNKPTGAVLVSTANISTTSGGPVCGAAAFSITTAGTYWAGVQVDNVVVKFDVPANTTTQRGYRAGVATLANINVVTATPTYTTAGTTFGTWPTNPTITESTASTPGGALVAFKVNTVP